MANFIMVSTTRRKKRSKEAEIEEAWRLRDAEILEYERKNPFTQQSWLEAWKSGWLRQHDLNIHSFPSPVLHLKKLWKKSKSPYYRAWREELRQKHKTFLRELRGE